ncbi:GNAT family N-acetyltransferase [Dactylosporangium sp. CA-233914]|uniref:GNAT family N-acetyltransferase n=1 Tax=Dactylosporangium sp. CA-233914 TaxID=3239934 RepID=UPI003D8F9AA2
MVSIPPRLVPVELGDLVLRAPVASDAAAVQAAFADPELLRWSPLSSELPDDPRTAALEWIEDRADWSPGTRLGWAVSDATSGPLLGTVSVRVIDARAGNGMIGYWTVPAARGRGIATRAVRAAARFAFDVAGLHRIELAHAVGNPSSCRVAQGAGFALEGTLRESYAYGDGQHHDEHLHAKLRTDPN